MPINFPNKKSLNRLSALLHGSSSSKKMPSVLLTGANGFIATYVLKFLLEKGYSVVGTVRSEDKIPYLRKLYPTDKLQFAVVKDFVVPGAFDEVIKAHKFNAVLHTASPFVLDVEGEAVIKQLYEPAINGTVGILKSVKEHGPTVKQVVTTSSIAAIVQPQDRPGYAYSEKDWNPLTWELGISIPGVGYFASKKLAEKAAWDFMDEEKPHFTLTTLGSAVVYGPPIQEVTSLEKFNESSQELYDYLRNKKPLHQLAWLWVDVRDIALAHVAAIETPAAANQRYLISGGNYSKEQFVEYIWKYYPERAEANNVPKPGPLYPEAGPGYSDDTSKSRKDLGLKYDHKFEETIKETYDRLIEIEKQFE